MCVCEVWGEGRLDQLGHAAAVEPKQNVMKLNAVPKKTPKQIHYGTAPQGVIIRFNENFPDYLLPACSVSSLSLSLYRLLTFYTLSEVIVICQNIKYFLL